jgi:phenylacetate-CoA ligase
MPEGSDGVLVLTTLTKRGMPLLRYWTNDICSLSYDKGGKRTHIKMSAIKGRADDMLIIRGVNLFPTQVEVLIRDIPELEPHYQLVVSKKGSLDRVDIRVEIGNIALELPQLEGLRNHLMQKVRDNIGLQMDVELVPSGSIPRSEGGKLSRILDLRRTS